MIVIKKISIVVILNLFFVGTNGLFGQRNNVKFDSKPKWIVGTDLKFAFNRKFRELGIAPFIGYRVTRKLTMGLKSPFKYSESGGLIRFKTFTGGLGILSRYELNEQFFLMTDYGLSRSKRNSDDQFESKTYIHKFNADFLNIGLGFRTKGKLWIELRINYNIISDLTFQFKSSEGFNLLSGIGYNFK